MKAGLYSSEEIRHGRFTYPIAVVLIGLMLSWPAVVNQFPLIFYDTSTYLVRAKFALDIALGNAPAQFEGAQPQNAGYLGATNPFFLRPFTYSMFLAPFATSLTFYGAQFVQALLSAYLVVRTLGLFGVRRLPQLLAAGAFIALLTSLPIQTSYIMPDVFTGLTVVASFLTVVSWRERSLPGRVFDILLMAFLFAVHLSHVPLALALIVIHLFIWLVARRMFPVRAVAFGLVLPLALAICALVASNYAVARRPVISESSSIFLQARLIGDGPGRETLEAECKTKAYLLCSQLDRLGRADARGSISDYFLWADEGAVKQINDYRLLAEAEELNAKTLERQPLQVVQHATWNFLRQLAHFQVDDDANTPPAAFVASVLGLVDPALADQHRASLQAHGRFPLAAARFLANAGLAISLAALAYCAIAQRRSIPLVNWMFGLVALTGVGANALAIGALSEVHDRYQNRVIWLIPLVALVIALPVLQRRFQPARDNTQAMADVGAA